MPRSGIFTSLLILYAVARLSQLWADRLPDLVIVVLHVVPPAIFAVLHCAGLYGRRGAAVFTAACLGTGALAEVIGVRTGFPFGSYHFTGVMGPTVLDVPVLLALAYLGMGYAAWIVALLVLGYPNTPLRGSRAVQTALLAALAMTAWDLAMDPSWSTIYRVWIWHRGGSYFGVPVSNFFGWFAVAATYYGAFAFYCRNRSLLCASARFWSAPAVLYALTAFGDLLIFRWPNAPAVVADPTGKQWLTSDILGACALVSVLLMGTLAIVALLRAAELSHSGIPAQN